MTEEMNLANDIIIKKYKPNDDLMTSHAINTPYNGNFFFEILSVLIMR